MDTLARLRTLQAQGDSETLGIRRVLVSLF